MYWDVKQRLPFNLHQEGMREPVGYNPRNYRTSYYTQRVVRHLQALYAASAKGHGVVFHPAERPLFPGIPYIMESRIPITKNKDVTSRMKTRGPLFANDSIIDALTLPDAWTNPWLHETLRKPVADLLARLSKTPEKPYTLWDDALIRQRFLPKDSPLLIPPSQHDLNPEYLMTAVARNLKIVEDNRSLDKIRDSLVKHDFAYDIKPKGRAAAARKEQASRARLAARSKAKGKGKAKQEDDEYDPDSDEDGGEDGDEDLPTQRLASREVFLGIDSLMRVRSVFKRVGPAVLIVYSNTGSVAQR